MLSEKCMESTGSELQSSHRVEKFRTLHLDRSDLKPLVAILVYAEVASKRNGRGIRFELLKEKTAGVISRIIVQSALDSKEYSVLVTDKRSIFVLDVSDEAGPHEVLGRAVGVAVGPSSGTVDHEQEDPDILATDPKNFVVPHEDLERIELEKSIIGPAYKFNIEYRTPDGKNKKMRGLLTPPEDMWKEREQEGPDEKIVCYDYAKMVLGVYQKALPPIASEALAEWNL